jgi:hypothetical protein
VDAFAELRARRGADPDALLAVRDLVVVVGSSRGGTTLVGELLRQVPGTVHLSGEANPFFELAGDDDEVLAAELSVDLGTPAATAADVDATTWRLLAQWPDLDLEPGRVRHWVDEAGDDTVALLHRARRDEPRIDPWYYDLPDDVLAAAFPDVPPAEGPPGARVVEMAPFLLPRPWRRATTEELAAGTLVLTTPRNVFRLDRLQRLFPNAWIRLLHLTRNPAAAVNGLLDGWLHRGFFSGRADVPLSIAGYSDRFPWGDSWWKFDPWPGCEAVAEQSLATVCATQWAAAHAAALAWPGERRQLRFEDVVGREPVAFAELAAWLGRPAATLDEVRLRPLMATAPPAPGRWSDRAEELLPVLDAEPVRCLADRLGYADRTDWV